MVKLLGPKQSGNDCGVYTISMHHVLAEKFLRQRMAGKRWDEQEGLLDLNKNELRLEAPTYAELQKSFSGKFLPSLIK